MKYSVLIATLTALSFVVAMPRPEPLAPARVPRRPALGLSQRAPAPHHDDDEEPEVPEEDLDVPEEDPEVPEEDPEAPEGE